MLKHEAHYTNLLKKEFNKYEGIKALYTDPLTDADGIPDLLVLNDHEREYAFVEVKKMNEPLRPNQTIWAQKYIHKAFMYIFRVQACGRKWILEQYIPKTGEVFQPIPDPLSLRDIVKEII